MKLETLLAFETFVVIGAIIGFESRLILALNDSHILRAFEFRRLLANAMALESDRLITPADSFQESICSFVSDLKSVPCEKYYTSAIKVRSEFSSLAKYLVGAEKNQTDIKSIMTDLEKLGLFNSYLNTAVKRYKIQIKEQGSITENDIKCDMIKYQIMTLHGILFVLETDFKYSLIVKNQQYFDEAIDEHLENDKTDLDDIYIGHRISQEQKDLLISFITDNMIRADKNPAINTLDKPGKYVFDKLYETCLNIVDYDENLKNLSQSYDQVCQGSNSHNLQFHQEFSPEMYDTITTMCQHFIIYV